MLDSRIVLDFTGKSLSKEEVRVLASDLEHKPVELLLLARTGLDDSKSKLLSKGIKRNKTITKLYLSGNQIGSSGATALCQALVRHPRITCINLAENPLTCEAAKELTGLVSKNGAIQQLVLDDCDLGTAGLTNWSR